MEKIVSPVSSLSAVPEGERGALRTEIYLLSGSTAKLNKGNKLATSEEKKQAGDLVKSLKGVTKFIPT